MSYHRAVILPGVQPQRRFAEAHSVWARQLRTIIPNERFDYNARNGRAIGNYSGPWGGAQGILGDSGDGLGSALVVI